MSNALVWLRRAHAGLLQGLLPRRCFLCAAASPHGLLCPDCEADLPRADGLRCPVCALRVPGAGPCGQCLASPPAFDASVACFDYAHPLSDLLQAFKYGQRLALAAWFAPHLAAQRERQGEAFDLLLPMPLHPARLRTRGFNQSMELVRALGRLGPVPPLCAGVERARNTPRQEGLSRRARRANLRHAFRCSARLDGARVLVVDDVMTTGASLDALARCLKEAGAARVGNLVLARTP